MLALVFGLVGAQAFGGPALANDQPPGTQPITVTRGGQAFVRNALEVERAPDGRLMRAGSFIVKFRSHAAGSERDDAHRIAGALGVDRLFSADTLRVQVGKGRSLAALNAYLSHRAVERVEPDYIAHTVLTPSDPSFSQQWGMTKINVGSAWDVSKSSALTRVAILDCGVYSEGSSSFLAPDGLPGHPDLRGAKVIDNKNFTTAPDADDFCNHGTHVAGIAAANTNNGVGVAGVGYLASIVNVKVLGDNGSGSFSWIINGILYAAGCDTTPCGPRRADIINMSLGATGSCSSSLQAAIDQAWSQGLVVAAAAGNSGASGAITPANCNRVIGVGASDQNDLKASFSNSGAGVDVSAPGVSILSTDYVGGYSSFSGTSMASPHVAGLAALVWTTAHNGGNQAVVDRITCTANKSALAGSTHGRIDAYAAVSVGGCVPPPPPPPPGDTGLRGPTANAAASGGDGNGFELNPANAYADGGGFAVDMNSGSGSSTSCTSSSKDKHVFRDYGFSIPSGSTIKGIDVRLDAKVDSTSGSPKICAQLSWNGGSSWTAAKSTATLGTAEGTHMLGGATDTWGRTWAVPDLSNASFRVRVIAVSSSTSRDFSLDWVAVRVHH